MNRMFSSVRTVTPPIQTPPQCPPNSPISPTRKVGTICDDIFDLTPKERLALLMQGEIRIADHNGEYDPLSAQMLGTISIVGVCIGFDTDGDLCISDIDDPDRPHYFDRAFFTPVDYLSIDLLVGKKIKFSYGPLVPGKYSITLVYFTLPYISYVSRNLAPTFQ